VHHADGEQPLCQQLGGAVEPHAHREFGRAYVDVADDCALFHGVWAKGSREQVWMSHGDRVTRLPPGFRVVGTSGGAPFAAIADDANMLFSSRRSIGANGRLVSGGKRGDIRSRARVPPHRPSSK
jgi:hypothetical protein